MEWHDEETKEKGRVVQEKESGVEVKHDKEKKKEEEENKMDTSVSLLDKYFGPDIPDIEIKFVQESQSLLAIAKREEELAEKMRRREKMSAREIFDDIFPPSPS